MSQAKLYAGTVGFVLDVKINGVESLQGVTGAKFYVVPPRTKEEEIWPVTIEVADKLFRHVIPQDKPVVRGTYKIQPYFELGDFKGRWGMITLQVDKEMT